MRFENDKIYIDDLIVAIIDSHREVIQIYEKEYLDSILDFVKSDVKFKDYSWETYSC